MKSKENLIKFGVNINLKKICWNKKTDETWCKLKSVDNYMKFEENLMKLEVNLNLKKIWWIFLWTHIWRNSNEIGRKSDEIWGEHKSEGNMMKFDVNKGLMKFDVNINL